MSEPRLSSSEELCSGARVRLERVRFSYNGREFDADRVTFGLSVAVLPVLEDGRVILERQWRPATGSWVLEAPAGRVERGETPEEAAMRELEEETGYRASRLTKVYEAYVSPGYSDEVQHGYIAEGLTRVGQRLEPDEVISLAFMRPEEALGQARDLKTIALLEAYVNLRRG
ncbi:NUDIX hydrolase [Acidilobus saccharovorans 345-15]|uniref:NUDIX hydrolase n=1 Tax=Acidilobus saccharovorans (strain DSM 16705 / JCM 18335 / VKM B-2471 / 345-15) TaxID=666510 RepID=D9PZG8_ACIS3|nr:NUDIX hydrolase [Acidilobus saccharovorans]ADL18456.1 NUDIX hydrolase [Acidilobus saccharovorans 345-15]